MNLSYWPYWSQIWYASHEMNPLILDHLIQTHLSDFSSAPTPCPSAASAWARTPATPPARRRAWSRASAAAPPSTPRAGSTRGTWSTTSTSRDGRATTARHVSSAGRHRRTWVYELRLVIFEFQWVDNSQNDTYVFNWIVKARVSVTCKWS